MADSEHTTNYQMVKNYYDVGLWSIKRVYTVTELDNGLGITEAEYQEITGFEYPNME